MIREFYGLQTSEVEMLLKAPILVCILIAGADGIIDKKEIQGAIEITKKRQAKLNGSLLEFYNFAVQDFEDKLRVLIQDYPKDSKDRNQIIEKELAEMNSIFPKLSEDFAREFYSSLREIALKIAKSSGGLLGLNSIGDEEVKYVDLPMIKNLTNL